MMSSDRRIQMQKDVSDITFYYLILKHAHANFYVFLMKVEHANFVKRI